MRFLQKVEDFFRGQKDKSEIINTQRFSFGTTYMWDGEKIIRSKVFSKDRSFTDEENIDWVNENPGKFHIEDLDSVDTRSIEVIKPQLFFKDLLDIANIESFQILGMEFGYDDWKNIYAKVWFREQDFEEGDGMPNDILNYFKSEIKNGLKKKSNFYLKNYNILSSRKGPQKMKYRTSPLYTTKSGFQSNFDLKKGIFNLEIAVNFN